MNPAAKYQIFLRRAYVAPGDDDGYRILVDRLWPRGIRKEALVYDEWAKTITPSPIIRKEFDHQAERFQTFREKYLAELNANPDARQFASLVHEKLAHENVTFVYGARDPQINHAIILKEWVEAQA